MLARPHEAPSVRFLYSSSEAEVGRRGKNQCGTVVLVLEWIGITRCLASLYTHEIKVVPRLGDWPNDQSVKDKKQLVL